MRKEALKYVLTENTTRRFPATVPRSLELPLNTTKITTLVGIRRSGKTYILYDTMRRLEASGVDRRQMIFLNFEDDRLMPIKTRELDSILSARTPSSIPSSLTAGSFSSSMRSRMRHAGSHLSAGCTTPRMRKSS